MYTKKGFRPLTGILFFNATTAVIRTKTSRMVSVPLRGFCFSTRVSGGPTKSGSQSFRPLTGILFFNRREKRMKDEHKSSFRPLTGILFFNLPNRAHLWPSAGHGFRPLTGILFFNWLQSISDERCAEMVSVPLRGFCFSTEEYHARFMDSFDHFRPLTGILFFNGTKKSKLWVAAAGFPSPYGDFVFQHNQECGGWIRFNPFPSPYGDFVFQLMGYKVNYPARKY